MDGRAAIRKVATAIFRSVYMVAPKSTQGSKQETGYGCLTRLCWMLFGNVGLIAFAIAIAKHKGSFLSFADLGFGLVILFLVGIRYFDITRMDGLTASERPASLTDWHRYILYLGISTLVLWGIVHTVAYFH
jgi:hypothetical protein